MSSDFRVGDEVVCIDVDNIIPELGAYNTDASSHLKLNEVYVITYLGISDVNGRPVLMVRGVEGMWFPRRFRKVQKKFTGMSILHSLLIDQPELVH
jgi:hypothetical protein